jgi:hypothetical protein
MKRFLLGSLFILLVLEAVAQQETGFQRWKFGVSGGMGYRTARFKDLKDEWINRGVDKDIAESFYDRQKWVQVINGEIYYLFNPSWGLGLKYRFTHSSAEKTNVMLADYPLSSDHVYIADIEQRNYFNFIGPSLYAQTWINSNKTFKAVSSVSIGYTNYRQENKTGLVGELFTGNAIGIQYGIGLEYFIHKKWAISSNLSFFNAIVGKVKAKNQYQSETIKLQDKISMAHLDLSIGICFYN